MLRLVVTASGCGPIAENTATYMAKSANSIMVGPDTVPPGRRLLFLEGPAHAHVAMRDALDAVPAAGIERLRKFRMQQFCDFVGRHGGLWLAQASLPLRRLARRLVLDGTIIRSTADFNPCHEKRAAGLSASKPDRIYEVQPATRASEAAAPVLLRERDGAIAVLVLNRPAARNSLSEALLNALSAAFADIAKDKTIRAVVLAANGRPSAPATT